MRYYYQTENPQHSDAKQLLWGLIAVNVLFYLLDFNSMALYCLPEMFRPWQVVTAMFLHSHSTFFHLFFNMYSLWLFGSMVAPRIGKVRFLLLYLLSGVIGNLLFLAFAWNTPSVVIGASGAVFGTMAAAAMVEPDRRFTLLLFPFAPLRTSTMVICFAVVEILLEFSGAQASVAHLAHLGGVLGGWLFMRYAAKDQVVWDPVPGQRGKGPRPVRPGSYGPPPPRSEQGFPHASGHVSPAELDALLDKLSRTGINSLSEYELARLKQAREEMRGK